MMLLVCCTVLVAAGVCTNAQAAITAGIGSDPGRIDVNAGSGEHSIYVSASRLVVSGTRRHLISSLGGEDVTALADRGCRQARFVGQPVSSSAVSCKQVERIKVNGGPVHDEIIVSAASNALTEIHGNDGGDDIYGSDQSDSIYGGEGPDVIYGAGGVDSIDGGRQGSNATPNDEDEIYGGSGGDLIQGNADRDELHGGPDNDTIHGGKGPDFIWGDAGRDRLYGEADVDHLYARDGEEDTLNCGFDSHPDGLDNFFQYDFDLDQPLDSYALVDCTQEIP